MRDINRINPLLRKIQSYWIKNPDLRLGQLLYNISYHAGYPDIFVIEDDKLSKALDDYFS